MSNLLGKRETSMKDRWRNGEVAPVAHLAAKRAAHAV